MIMNEGLLDRLEKYGFSLYMIRITLAASLSWVAVHSLYGDQYLYFAPLAAILITQASVKASLKRNLPPDRHYYRWNCQPDCRPILRCRCIFHSANSAHRDRNCHSLSDEYPSGFAGRGDLGSGPYLLSQ